MHRTPSGAWALTRYEDVREALADARLGNAPGRHAVVGARNRERYACADVASNILPFLDAPDHAAPRRVISRAFHAQLRATPPDIEVTANRLLDTWHEESVRDVVADYASPLALSIIGHVVGVPAADLPRLEPWSEAFFYLFTAIPSTEVRERLDRSLTDFRRYLTDLLEASRRAPADNLTSALTRDSELPDAQIVDNLMLLFADGVENVDRAIGSAVYTLLRHPDQLDRVRRSPEILPFAVAECLRYESPAQYIGRVAREDCPVGGVVIPEGSTVLLVLGAANRDDRVFEAADRIDVGRDPNPHLAFGRGSHSCVGGSLVEQQMQIALGTLLRRFPRITLESTAVSWLTRPGHRWVDAVPVRPRG